ncbi:MAG: hypothetical protein LBC86_05645 [Oscillospiraceae bacterium]|nr:hypothetical protein [Oscillospiraceae bacterium]
MNIHPKNYHKELDKIRPYLYGSNGIQIPWRKIIVIGAAVIALLALTFVGYKFFFADNGVDDNGDYVPAAGYSTEERERRGYDE